MLRFTQKDIKEEFDAGSYSRGLGYFKQGRVSSLFVDELSQTAIEIKAVVAGRDVYSQSISVIKEDYLPGLNSTSSFFDFEGGCTCPVGFNCKHVVAALLEYIREHPADVDIDEPEQEAATAPLNVIEDWLVDLTPQAALANKNTQKAQKKWLAYILSPTSIKGEVSVSLRQSGHKVKGGYLKPRKLDLMSHLRNIRFGYNQSPENSDDNEIIRLLSVLNTRWGNDLELPLVGQIGGIALQKMLATKRCFWQDLSKEFLSLGAPVSLDFGWNISDLNGEKVHQLTCQNDENTHLLLTDPPCQINLINNQVEAFITELNDKQMSKLLNAPKIAQKDVALMNLNIIQKNLDQVLPLPLPTKIEEQLVRQIRPKAVMSKYADPEFGLQPRNCLSLSWLYDDIEIQYQDDLTLVVPQDDKIVRLVRDIKREEHLLLPLMQRNFVLRESKAETHLENKQIMAIIGEQQAPLDYLNHWHRFLEVDRFELEDLGWVIDEVEDFQMDFIYPHDDWQVEIESDSDWFSLKFDIALDESEKNKLPLLPIVSNLLTQYDIESLPEKIMVEYKPDQFLILPKTKVKPVFELMYELFDRTPRGEESIKLSTFDALLVSQLDTNASLNIRWSGDLSVKTLGEKLANFDGIKSVQPAKVFKGLLREYQLQGLSWLQFLREFGFGGILADDMGLGKTVQTLAHIQKEKMAKRLTSPCLIIAPTSLMSNWRKEASHFTPNLKVHVSQGERRAEHFEQLAAFDIIFTTYPLIVRDFSILSNMPFHMVVLDEAQNIKNPKSKTSKAIKSLNAEHKLALTGTPMENHLGELWSIFDFLMPGFLGNESTFRSKYRNPIEKENDQSVLAMLNKRVAPFLLRRTKQNVAKELPPKTEIIKTVSFEAPQSMLYETIRLSMEKKVQQAIATKGLNRSHIMILDALLKLRQVCCDPQLVKLDQAKKVKQSAKMDLLMLMLPELIEEGRKVLIFSQFTSMLDIIESAIQARQIRYTKLTGKTKNRDEAIAQFSSGDADVFLISLKAGGVGLNLTEADTVIHYDPWWNPAVENQASDRAHRIGQDKPVFVYKFVVENTLEEKILKMQKEKQALADGIYGDKHTKDASQLTAKDLEELLGSDLSL